MYQIQIAYGVVDVQDMDCRDEAIILTAEQAQQLRDLQAQEVARKTAERATHGMRWFHRPGTFYLEVLPFEPTREAVPTQWVYGQGWVPVAACGHQGPACAVCSGCASCCECVCGQGHPCRAQLTCPMCGETYQL